jgi:hypothetical protein
MGKEKNSGLKPKHGTMSDAFIRRAPISVISESAWERIMIKRGTVRSGSILLNGSVHRLAILTALGISVANLQAEDRTIDGTRNNLSNPTWGSAGIHLWRIVEPRYADHLSEPAGANRLTAREISNAVFWQVESLPDANGMSSFVWQWGQFIDHDIDLTPSQGPEESLDILVPLGDPWFDPDHEGGKTIGFTRSTYDPGTGGTSPREQLNVITSWIDASNVYGSDDDRAAWLRTFSDGKLKTSQGNLLPFNDGTRNNAESGPLPGTAFFVAGDIRSNEQVGLTAMHTLFVREHNRLADQIRGDHPDGTDEQIYQQARKFVISLMQSITYNEFLPALLGVGALSPYAGYDDTVNASIMNEFSTALFRVGHTMLPSVLLRLDEDGDEIPEGNLPLRDGFFNPVRITDEGGIAPLLRGLAAQQMQNVDARVVDDVRNFLFGPPGSGGFDLVALNIQRGRDHGLSDYNTVRLALGLPPAADFDDITSDSNLAAELALLYGSVNDVDLWVGALAEDHKPGAVVGELVYHALKDQFTRLRDGDRFWYEIDPDFTPDQIAEIRRTKLSDVIRRNTEIRDIQPNVFFVLGFSPQPMPPGLFGMRFCGPGILGMMPFMLLGWTGMKRISTSRTRH